ncbi:hypothetical protein [Niabella aurantiaca]|nr:hypothetical protein [Niabella aurantiaca]
MSGNYFMPYYRNFTYWIDKRHWKYCFLLASLAMNAQFQVQHRTLF